MIHAQYESVEFTVWNFYILLFLSELLELAKKESIILEHITRFI
jgi:hypothetical protein